MESILKARRDPRIDVLRGLALLMIFVDHMPGNLLGFATLHVFGFADAAEIFVLFAGFASLIAYGKPTLREGFVAGTRRVGLRCLRIYLTHVLLLITTMVVVRSWTKTFHVAPVSIAPLLDAGWEGLLRGLTLHALPQYLDILPLYIVLLAMFPLLFAAMRWRSWAGLAAASLVWLAAMLDSRLNLPNWLQADGWYFNPFSWLLLFALGAWLALRMSQTDNRLTARPWLNALCWTYLAFALLETFPWGAWGLPSLRPVAMAAPDKTHFSLWRLLDIMAWVQIVFSSERTRAWAASRLARPLEACGRHSLEVFAFGCLLALFGRLIFRTFGRDLALQVGVNLVGIVAMCVLAICLDRAQRRSAERRDPLSERAHLVGDGGGYLAHQRK